MENDPYVAWLVYIGASSVCAILVALAVFATAHAFAEACERIGSCMETCARNYKWARESLAVAAEAKKREREAMKGGKHE